VDGRGEVPFEGDLPAGTLVLSLARALREHPGLIVSHLGRYAKFDEHAFTALNTAFFHDGAFIYVPKGVVVEKPIHLLYVSAPHARPQAVHPRNLIVAGENSQITIVESYLGRDGDTYFTNAVTEVVAGPNAVIDHYKVQREGDAAFHVATLQVHQERASNFRSHSIALGGALVRNDVNAVLAAEGCECVLNGLTMAGGRQLIDNHTRIDHAKPNCNSHELYKAVLDGKAHGVFNGKIFVHADAQKTDAKQTNQTLLLSADATIDTKPQLEIFADDVKCTHGATVGQLDDNMIFYLRSRGIGRAAARSLLTFAFANDIISRIKVGPVRRQLEELLLVTQGLPEDETIEEQP
jgi:Fe-S cluster assembly protein SufD